MRRGRPCAWLAVETDKVPDMIAVLGAGAALVTEDLGGLAPEGAMLVSPTVELPLRPTAEADRIAENPEDVMGFSA